MNIPPARKGNDIRILTAVIIGFCGVVLRFAELLDRKKP